MTNAARGGVRDVYRPVSSRNGTESMPKREFVVDQRS
jgi:hypothetical protein